MEFSQGYRKDPLKTWRRHGWQEVNFRLVRATKVPDVDEQLVESHDLHCDMVDGLKLTVLVS